MNCHSIRNASRRSVRDRHVVGTALAALAAILVAAPAPAADLGHGEEVFRACAACHTEKPDALGPSLKGVIGRKSAALEDFRYSNPMRRANLVWDEANLRQFLADPQGKVAGTRMPFGGLGDPKDIDDVVGYLATLK
jgi:cytochrome c